MTATSMLAVPTSSRASPLSQWFWVFAHFGYNHSTCGSWLASDSGMSGTIEVGFAGPIAGKPAPTVVPGCSQILGTPTQPVGAGLPAIAVCQAPSKLALPAPSRASCSYKLRVDESAFSMKASICVCTNSRSTAEGFSSTCNIMPRNVPRNSSAPISGSTSARISPLSIPWRI